MSATTPANRMHDLAVCLESMQVRVPAETMTRIAKGEPDHRDYNAVRKIEKSLAAVGRTDGFLATIDSMVRGEREHPSTPHDREQYALAHALRTAIGTDITDKFKIASFFGVISAYG